MKAQIEFDMLVSILIAILFTVFLFAYALSFNKTELRTTNSILEIANTLQARLNSSIVPYGNFRILIHD